MKLFPLFLSFLLLFLVLIAMIWFTPMPEQATGTLHPTYTSLLKSGRSVVTNATAKWLAYLYGFGILGIFGFSLFIGFRKTQAAKNRTLLFHLALVYALYLGGYVALLFSYESYTLGERNGYFLGVPYPTAWMLFGLTSIPLYLSILYITRFEQLVLSPEELEAFHQLVAARRKKHESSQTS